MSIYLHLPILQVILPMLMAPLVVLLQPRGLAWAATAATCAVSFIIAINLTATVMNGYSIDYDLGGWVPPFGISLRIDALRCSGCFS